MQDRLSTWLRSVAPTEEGEHLVLFGEHIIANIKDKLLEDEKITVESARIAIGIIQKEFINPIKLLQGKIRKSPTNKDYR